MRFIIGIKEKNLALPDLLFKCCSLFLNIIVLVIFFQIVNFFVKMKQEKLKKEKRELTKNHIFHIRIIYTLAWLNLLESVLDLAYPLLSFMEDL